MDKVNLSVVVPVYNAAQYLDQCIQSILNQTVSVYEIILVDDGSTDNSLQICNKYAAAYPQIKSFHQKNRGVSGARYIGECVASGDYLTFVDADDWISATVFEKVQTFMQLSYDVISYNIIRFYDDDYQIHSSCKFIGSYNRGDMEKKIFPTMLWNAKTHECDVDASLCNKVVKRGFYHEALETICKLGIHYGEDVGVIYQSLLNAKNIYFMDEALYYHRQRKAGQMASYKVDEKYIDKLYLLYKYMRKTLGRGYELPKQIEYFLLHALEVRTGIYGDQRTRKSYLFPFDRIHKDEKIVIYGAGKVGRQYMEQLSQLNYCDVVLWVDKKEERSGTGKRIYPISEINNVVDYDHIVIAAANMSTVQNIENTLSQMGIDKEKVISA